MWTLKDGFLTDSEFPFFNFVTTGDLGDMKDVASRDKVCSLKGVDKTLLVMAEQTHGGLAAAVGVKDGGRVIEGADAMITGEKGVALAIFTADCVPVIFGAKEKACGAAHAGWRGLYKGILPATVKLFKKEFGILPEELTASIGPHICGGCYAVGDEIRRSFMLPGDAAKFSLADEAVRQLKNEGVREIHISKYCTMHESNMFFSYRRDKTPARIMTLVNFK